MEQKARALLVRARHLYGVLLHGLLLALVVVEVLAGGLSLRAATIASDDRDDRQEIVAVLQTVPATPTTTVRRLRDPLRIYSRLSAVPPLQIPAERVSTGPTRAPPCLQSRAPPPSVRAPVAG